MPNSLPLDLFVCGILPPDEWKRHFASSILPGTDGFEVKPILRLSSLL